MTRTTLPKKLDRVDEEGNLYFDGSPFPWRMARRLDEDKRWGYPVEGVAGKTHRKRPEM